MTLPSAEQIRSLFNYNPETGSFLRKGMTGSTPLLPRINGKQYYVHRLIWLHYYGEWPKHFIDHINGNPRDNRIENLRDVTNKENTRNRKRNINNHTGYTGVYLSPHGTYTVGIRVDGKQYWKYGVQTLEEAVTIRKQLEREHNFHPNHGMR